MTQEEKLPFEIPPSTPEEDRRKAGVFLRALGLDDEWANYYAGIFTLKENINNALSGLGSSSGSDKNRFFVSFACSHIPPGKVAELRDMVLHAIEANPHVLNDKELISLADSIKRRMNSERSKFLKPDSVEVQGARRFIDQNSAYKNYPALLLLRAIGITQPEKMTHDGFLHTANFLFEKIRESVDIANNLPPLPLARLNALHQVLTHPTPLLAVLIGLAIRREGKNRIMKLVDGEDGLNELIGNTDINYPQ